MLELQIRLARLYCFSCFRISVTAIHTLQVWGGMYVCVFTTVMFWVIAIRNKGQVSEEVRALKLSSSYRASFLQLRPVSLPTLERAEEEYIKLFRY